MARQGREKHRLINRMLKESNPLVLSFTNKSIENIKQRLRDRIQNEDNIDITIDVRHLIPISVNGIKIILTKLRERQYSLMNSVWFQTSLSPYYTNYGWNTILKYICSVI